MLSKRIIPCLDIKDGTTVKGVNFENLIEAGDPIELARRYVDEKADELVFLDITATLEERKTFAALVKEIAGAISIPFTVGGGISTIQDVGRLLESGADKVGINSAAVKNPDLIDALAAEFGSQCVVIAIDTRATENGDEVYINAGKKATGIATEYWAQEVVNRGAGEILLTSMDHDGTKGGFALSISKRVTEMVSVPVIASGGAGNEEHFLEVFADDVADAALAASIFHFGEVPIPTLKRYLQDNGVTVRL